MKKTVSGLAGAILAVLGLVAVPASSYACSCIARAYSPQERLDASQGAFVGKVISFGPEAGASASSGDKIALLQVSRYWKSIGEVRTFERIRTAQDSAACGISFEVGKEYLVFAQGIAQAVPQGQQGDPNNKYMASLCSGTALSKDSGSIIAGLGAGIIIAGGDILPPTPSPAPAPSPTPSPAPSPSPAPAPQPLPSAPQPAPGADDKFTINLSLGMTHPDVFRLQRYLNAQGFAIAASGAGSDGNETAYFGTRTRDALVRFQSAYAAKLGIVSGTGYFGMLTRALLNG